MSKQARFSDVLKSVNVQVSATSDAAKKKLLDAARATIKPWQKRGGIEALKPFTSALPGECAAEFITALGEEIAHRGRDWARLHLHTALANFVDALASMKEEAAAEIE